MTELKTPDRLKLSFIEKRVCDVTAVTLRIRRRDVRPSSRLVEDLNADSLDLAELCMQLEETFDVTLPFDNPNPVYKAVFTRRSFRLSDIAEIVYLQIGTGRPERGRHYQIIRQANTGLEIRFTQLGGRWDSADAVDQGPLLEPLEGAGRYAQFRRRSDGMRCVLIPGAEVEIGSEDADALSDEQPLHAAAIDTFLMDAEPVSTTAYCRFLNSINADQRSLSDWVLLTSDDDRQAHMPILQVDGEWEPVAGMEQLPMVLVSWYGANAYSLWANAEDWADYRAAAGFLPSEAQWEYAARGRRSQAYPWGGDPVAGEFACARHQPGTTYAAETMPLAAVHEQQGMSPFELHHMAGNVWQWCRDWYDETFYSREDATGPNPVNLANSGVRSERGGSWVGPATLCRSSYRRGRPPNARGRCLGFRCISRLPETVRKR